MSATTFSTKHPNIPDCATSHTTPTNATKQFLCKQPSTSDTHADSTVHAYYHSSEHQTRMPQTVRCNKQTRTQPPTYLAAKGLPTFGTVANLFTLLRIGLTLSLDGAMQLDAVYSSHWHDHQGLALYAGAGFKRGGGRKRSQEQGLRRSRSVVDQYAVDLAIIAAISPQSNRAKCCVSFARTKPPLRKRHAQTRRTAALSTRPLNAPFPVLKPGALIQTAGEVVTVVRSIHTSSVFELHYTYISTMVSLLARPLTRAVSNKTCIPSIPCNVALSARWFSL